MAYIEHLEQLRTHKRRRLQILEEQQARSGHSTDPRITLEIEDIKKALTKLDAEHSEHSKLLNLFQRYENGFIELLDRVQRGPGRSQILEYQRRLRHDIEQVREAGDTLDVQDERERIVREIDGFAIEEVGKGFYELCGISPGANASDLPPPAPSSQPLRSSAPHAGAAHPSIGSINAQNIAFGDQTIGNQINIKTTNHYLSSEKQPQLARQPADQDVLNQHILALGQAVKQHALPELIEPAREQALDLQRAFVAADVSKMAAVLIWFEQHLPTLSNSVRAIICHPIVRSRVNAAGTAAVREFQRRFGTYDHSQER